jgi:hypothetical protein
MTCRVHNLTHRLVSIHGNSGQTWHLPPRTAIELIDAEVMENAKVAKLIAKGAIAVHREETGERPSRTPERGRRARSQAEGIGE